MKKPQFFLFLTSTSTGVWKDENSQPVIYISGEPIANTWNEFSGWVQYVNKVPYFKIVPIQLNFTHSSKTSSYLLHSKPSCNCLSCDITLMYDEKVLPDKNTLILPSTKTWRAFVHKRGEYEQTPSQPALLGFTFRFICSHIDNEMETFHEIMKKNMVDVYVPITEQYRPSLNVG